MARQIDYVTLYIHVARRADGTYEKRLQSVSTCVCDPNPSSGNDIDKLPMVHSDQSNYGVAFSGSQTVDQLVTEALAAVASRAGVTLSTGRVLNRTTKEYIVDVDTSSYSSADWVVNPDVTAVSTVSPKYWKLTGDAVSEMSQPEKDAVDAGSLPSLKGARIAGLKMALTDYVSKHYDAGQQSTINVFWNEANSKGWTNRKALCQQVLDWVNSVMTHFYAKVDEVLAATSIAAVNSVALDLAQFNATDPHVSIRTVKNTVN